ncbi:MAG: homoserine O-acetyltransferase [Verrucomicrobiota bacterium]
MKTALQTQVINEGSPYTFRDGGFIPALELAYETYGILSASGDNAILVFHALSGTPHMAGINEEGPTGPAAALWTEECHQGWWESFVGPGKALDTDRYFVICANYVGGCYGSTGPASINPRTGKPYGSSFPHISAADIVDSQVLLLDHLGIQKLRAVVGASIGGLLSLSFATLYPERTEIVVSLASALEISVLQKLVIFEQALAIENDAHFLGGDYYDGPHPESGLRLARMISHKTFISLKTLARRARKDIGSFDDALKWYNTVSPLESYMLYQGQKFVKRFDANTYLRILEIWHTFHPLRDREVESMDELFAPCRKQQWLVFSIDSDVCFYPDQQAQLATALRKADVPHMHITVHSEKGHDSFLLEPGLFTPHLQFALDGGIEEHHQ